jgi:DnaJ-class molecular chaperone
MSESACPKCGGFRRIGPVHINRGSLPHLWLSSVPCRFCHGSGTVSEERRVAHERGERLRAERVARNESLREAAQRLGVSASKLSALERGDMERLDDC